MPPPVRLGLLLTAMLLGACARPGDRPADERLPPAPPAIDLDLVRSTAPLSPALRAAAPAERRDG